MSDRRSDEFRMSVGDAEVRFRTERHQPAYEFQRGGKARVVKATTTCQVMCGIRLTYGTAWCSVKDRYDVLHGYRLALARALVDHALAPSEQRRILGVVMRDAAAVVSRRVRRPRTLREHHRWALVALREIVALVESGERTQERTAALNAVREVATSVDGVIRCGSSMGCSGFFGSAGAAGTGVQ